MLFNNITKRHSSERWNRGEGQFRFEEECQKNLKRLMRIKKHFYENKNKDRQSLDSSVRWNDGGIARMWIGSVLGSLFRGNETFLLLISLILHTSNTI